VTIGLSTTALVAIRVGGISFTPVLTHLARPQRLMYKKGWKSESMVLADVAFSSSQTSSYYLHPHQIYPTLYFALTHPGLLQWVQVGARADSIGTQSSLI
jgi:hypothetical protein